MALEFIEKDKLFRVKLQVNFTKKDSIIFILALCNTPVLARIFYSQRRVLLVIIGPVLQQTRGLLMKGEESIVASKTLAKRIIFT